MKEFLRDLKRYITYYQWLLKGRPGIAPHIMFKRKRIVKFSKMYNCNTFIETGTHDGRTVKFLRNRFKKLMSVEVYKPCFDNSLKRTKSYSNIKLFFGDSKIMLPRMLEQIEGRALFWLDGHFSGHGTGKSEVNCPVNDELEAIKRLDRKDHLILIDDAREFIGQNDYPDIKLVMKKLKEINPNYKIEVSNDCIIAVPDKF
ncbi:MAG: hypothetical protein WAQ28_20150 [Bacteroidia bacterium]|jgi:hypothetical protein